MPITRSGYGKPQANRTYRAQQHARNIRNNATHCAICGQPFQPGQPRHAGHTTPRAYGGNDYNLAATHATCNMRTGAMPITPPDDRSSL